MPSNEPASWQAGPPGQPEQPWEPGQPWQPGQSGQSGQSEASVTEPRHRLPKQRGVARGSTVLGAAAIAAVGATGVAAAAQGGSTLTAPISTHDLAPGAAPRTDRNAGESLRTRILAQAQGGAPANERPATADPVPGTVPGPRSGSFQDFGPARAAAAKEAAARKVREEAARRMAEEEARQRAAAEAAERAERDRLAQLAASYLRPLASYTLAAGYGHSGDPWSAAHTGLDFAAPTGTPAVAVHGGVITSAGWAGPHGYRIVLTLDDGTQLWYCHLSSMVRTSGRVTTGDVIGRVGATGNAGGPHLHLEVRPDGAAPIDPAPWLRDHGICV